MISKAELYTNLHCGTPGDLEFYLERCQGQGRVLELGSGAGRVALFLAQAGVSVTGIELEEALLDMAERERTLLDVDDRARVSFSRGDMTSFALAERFERIILPFSTIFCLSPSDRARCFQSAVAHLKEGGQLILDTYPPSDLDGLEPVDGLVEPLADLEWDDYHLQVFQRVDLYKDHQFVDVTYGHSVLKDGVELDWIEYRLRHYVGDHLTLRAELEEAGLHAVSCLGDFEGAPFDDDSDHLVIIATRR